MIGSILSLNEPMIMNRKTPQQQIEAARASLARAQARQRQANTREKIVLGGLLLSWLRSDEKARHALLSRIAEYPLREQDADVLAELISQLHASVPDAQPQSQVVDHV